MAHVIWKGAISFAMPVSPAAKERRGKQPAGHSSASDSEVFNVAATPARAHTAATKVVPLAGQAGWEEVKAFSQAVAQHMAAALPKYFTAKMGVKNRRNKIFVDYLRNNRGSSTVVAYSAHARPGLGVSVPLSWDEVPDTRAGDQWTIANLHERLDTLKKDPWAGYAKTRQRMTVAIKKRLDEAAADWQSAFRPSISNGGTG